MTAEDDGPGSGTDNTNTQDGETNIQIFNLMESLKTVEAVRGLAEMFVEDLKEYQDKDAGYTEADIETLDEWTTKTFGDGNDAAFNISVGMVGAYYGEIVAHEFQGEWVLDDEDKIWKIKIPLGARDLMVSSFAAADERITKGKEHSFAQHFSKIRETVKHADFFSSDEGEAIH